MDIRGYLGCVVLISFATTIEAATVNTNDGAIEGLTTNLATGKTVDAFLGIPYAMPPLETLRFASPQPVKPWDGTLQTKVKSPGCIQQASEKEKQTVCFTSNLTESEDCLYLNVWRPAGSEQKNLTVMVWVHGGAFVAGSASMSLYDGSILATEENVIVVSMNYRFSLFGLLYLGIPEAPGNLNLQDQILAFKWVQRNIESFGGDPNKVTVFGESAGSISIGYHLTNSEARPLFRNAIMESGSANVQPAIASPAQALNQAVALAKKQNCPYSDKKEMLNCLQSKNTSELISPYMKIPPYLVLDFSQVSNGVEVCENVQTCLLDLPVEERKPILIGTTKDEFKWFSTFFFSDIPIDNDTVITGKQWTDLIGNVFMLRDARLQKVAMEPYQGYYKTYDPAQVRVEAATFISDAFMTCPSVGFQSTYFTEKANMYMYLFTEKWSKPRTPMPPWVGTVHADEIPFVFGAPVDPTNNYSSEDAVLSKKVMAYWAQFAKTSDPNGNDPERTFWPPFDPVNKTYLSLGVDSYPSSNLKQRECTYWGSTYPLLVSLQMELTKLENNKTC